VAYGHILADTINHISTFKATRKQLIKYRVIRETEKIAKEARGETVDDANNVLFRVQLLQARVVVREGEFRNSSPALSVYKDFSIINSRASSINSIQGNNDFIALE
jgi:hypothetical protein